MSNFYAMARKRGEVAFYRVAFLDNYFGSREYGVRFLEGPHKGEIYPEAQCALRKDDEWKKDF